MKFEKFLYDFQLAGLLLLTALVWYGAYHQYLEKDYWGSFIAYGGIALAVILSIASATWIKLRFLDSKSSEE